ncbi:hypothetical protein [Halobacillus ihumii]|uniref:hypothetical protein n=1 Tax=Halobacillus ihumii TaxID=2686092 RepID=UPI0013D43E7F|nr:hypothetical protein [Halobacillus ihumii]
MRREEIERMINEGKVSNLQSQIDFLQNSITNTLTLFGVLMAFLGILSTGVIIVIQRQSKKAKEAMDNARLLHENAHAHINEAKKQKDELSKKQNEVTEKLEELEQYNEKVEHKIVELEELIKSTQLEEKLELLEKVNKAVDRQFRKEQLELFLSIIEKNLLTIEKELSDRYTGKYSLQLERQNFENKFRDLSQEMAYFYIKNDSEIDMLQKQIDSLQTEIQEHIRHLIDGGNK